MPRFYFPPDSGKGLGKGPKRNRKVLRDNIQGITEPAIRRQARHSAGHGLLREDRAQRLDRGVASRTRGKGASLLDGARRRL